MQLDKPSNTITPTCGADIDLGRYQVRVVDVGTKPHSGGFGDTDFRAVVTGGYLPPGSIINTPWGTGEIVIRTEYSHFLTRNAP